MAPGLHRIEHEVIEGWEQMPEGWAFVEVAAFQKLRRRAG